MGGKKILIPSTFIELTESIFSLEVPIMQKNINQLNKFIFQTSNAKTASMTPKITTKTIQKSLE